MGEPMGLRPSLVKAYELQSTRGYWPKKREFILSCIGYATGISNIWRFPYLCYRNGGGAFLVPYILLIVICGIPLYYLEMTIGQFASTGYLTMFRMSPIFKGLGYTILVVNIICTAYYSLIATYPLVFMANCLYSVLPWSNCDNHWNTENCIDLSDGNVTLNDNGTNLAVTAAEEFFHNRVLEISNSIEEVGTIVCPVFLGHLFTWFVVYLCVSKGIRTMGKAVYFTVTFPILVLICVFGRGVSLPGALKGISFYLYPDWQQLGNLRVWSDAGIHVFYTLGPGWGGILNLASYNTFSNNHLKDAIIIPVINCVASIFAGLCVFSIIGHLSEVTGLPAAEVVTAGPGLIYITFPAAVAMLPWPNFWGFFFFLMLFLFGINTIFIQLEAVLMGIKDECPKLQRKKKKFTIFCCALMFLVSIICTTNGGIYIITLLDGYVPTIPVILVCFGEVIMIGWVYDVRRFVYDIEFMRCGKKVRWTWRFLWQFVCPIILVCTFCTTIAYSTTLTYKGDPFPEWCEYFGWTLCIFAMILFPLYAFYIVLFRRTGTLVERIKSAAKPTQDWGPNVPKIAEAWRKSMQAYFSDKPDLETKSVQCSMSLIGKTIITIGPKSDATKQ